MSCECGDEVFSGIPCRHSVAIATSSNEVNFQSLNFNPRWKISYYNELPENLDPEELPLPPGEIVLSIQSDVSFNFS